MSTAFSFTDIFRRTCPESHAPLIENIRLFGHPEVSWSRFFMKACFTEGSLSEYRKTENSEALERTDIGNKIFEHMKEGLFFDVPCGYAHLSNDEDFALLPVLGQLGFSRVVECDIDAKVLGERIGEPEDSPSDNLAMKIRSEGSVSVAAIQQDVLGALSKTDPDALPMPVTYYLSGIQCDLEQMKNGADTAVSYLIALYDELARLCQEKDLIVLNDTTTLTQGIDTDALPHVDAVIALTNRGLRQIAQDNIGKVRVFARSNI